MIQRDKKEPRPVTASKAIAHFLPTPRPHLDESVDRGCKVRYDANDINIFSSIAITPIGATVAFLLTGSKRRKKGCGGRGKCSEKNRIKMG